MSTPATPHTPASAPNTDSRAELDAPDPQRPTQEQPVTLPPAARSLARGLAWALAGLTIAAVALGVLWLLG